MKNNNNGKLNNKHSHTNHTHELEQCDVMCMKNNDTFQALFESAPDAMLLVNDSGKIVFMNNQVETLFGYNRDELLNKDIEVLLPQRFRLKHKELRKGYFKSPGIRKMGSGLDLYGYNKDGSEFSVDISLSPLVTDNGMFITCAIRDTSDRKAAENKIKQSYEIQSAVSTILRIALEKISLEKQLERSLDVILSLPALPLQSKGCIYLVADDRNVLIMKAERGLSQTHKNVCARVPFGRCLCGRCASQNEIVFAECLYDCQETLSNDIFSHGQYCIPITSSDNQVIGVMSLFLKEGYKREPESEKFLFSVADALAGIIEHKKTEIEKQHLLDQLIQNEKLSALGRMTANVAHEIRNPLTALGGFARQLHKKITEGTKEKEYSEVIISEVKRLERILGNVLTFSKEKPLNRTLINITTIIDESLKTFEFVFKDHLITVEKKYNIIPYLSLDRDKIREVIDNLITNAVDSMPRGGRVKLTIDHEYDNGFINAVVKITDTGAGISEHTLKSIFEPFYTTKATGDGNGTGLGLSISKKIVEQHGGFIKIDSTEGKGTTFSLHFPCNHVKKSQLYHLPANQLNCEKDKPSLYCEID